MKKTIFFILAVSLLLAVGFPLQGGDRNATRVERSTHKSKLVGTEMIPLDIERTSIFMLNCSNWNEELQSGSLIQEEDGIISKSEKASLLAAYVKGVSDALDKALPKLVKIINRACTENTRQKISDAITRLSRT